MLNFYYEVQIVIIDARDLIANISKGWFHDSLKRKVLYNYILKKGKRISNEHFMEIPLNLKIPCKPYQ